MRKFKKLLVMLLTISLISASFAGIAMAKTKTGWQKEGDYWVYIDKDGSYHQGWLEEKGKWYYLDYYMYTNGAYDIDGKVYVFNKKGVMQKNGWASTTYSYGDGLSYTSWYYLNRNGSAKTAQWFKDGGKWYYFTDRGEMAAGRSYVIKGKGYVFDKKGVWISSKGWHKITDNGFTSWYYVKANGTGYNGWMQDGGYWYFLNYGRMASNGGIDTNQTYVEGKEHVPNVYVFDAKGRMITKEGWFGAKYTYANGSYTDWYYVKSNGKAITGWKKISGKWYYFEPMSGWMYSDGPYRVNDKAYMFESNGALSTKTGWYKLTRTNYEGDKFVYWYYLKKGGVCTTGWKKIGKNYYYFGDYEGNMYSDGTYWIGDKEYTFDKNGVWKK